jgi:chromate transporter, chromate ion transporter (CHR) family
MAEAAARGSVWTVFLIFLRLGLTSFGGPVAHLGYFRNEFVTRRAWLDERSYADLVALCQFLPGPASSQVGMGIGYTRAGTSGALAAWAGFTLPSALAMILFALGIQHWGRMPEGVGHGLKVVAVAVVAQAVWGMMRTLCPGRTHRAIMLGAAMFVLALPAAWNQLVVILAAGAFGCFAFAGPTPRDTETPRATTDHRAALALLAVFAILLAGLPLLSRVLDNATLAMVDVFYRTGALVFGGGHVMLPLLQAEVVPPRVGRQRYLPRRLRRGAGHAGPAIHLRRLSRRLCQRPGERLVRRNAGAGGDLSSVLPARPRRAAVLGSPARQRHGPLPRSAASTPGWSACCSRRSTIRYGQAPSIHCPTSSSQQQPFSP